MKSTTFFISLLPALSTLFLAHSVDAHGFIPVFGVDGTNYAGNTPAGPTNPSPIRQISTIDPVKGATNPNISCGQDAQNADMVVDAMPGSKITFQWSDINAGWPHNTGPLMTYMASCGNTTCDKFDPTDAQWFKIDEAGLKPNDDSVWIQQDIMNGKSYTTKIPSTLASGQYLIRHEIIALHLAVTLGGAEFYPSCTQVNVGGNQTSLPSSSELVSFPGAYSDNDPGIFDPDVFNPGANYTFPGPPIAAIAAGDNSSSSTGNPITPGPSNSTSGSGSPSNTTNPSTSSTGSVSGSKSTSCSLKRSLAKRSNIPVADTKTNFPRHMSRIMARLAHGDSW